MGIGGPAGTRAAFRDEQAAALLRQVARGDRAAMDQLYGLFEGPVHRLAMSRLNDPGAAGDVLNQTMIRIWRDAGRFRGESKVLTWVLGIAFQKTLDRGRGRHRGEAEAPDPAVPADEAGDMARVLERMEDIGRVRSAVNRLSATQRSALHLAFHEDLSYGEIAGVIGCPERAAKTTVFHAKQALKALLAVG